MEHTGHFRYSYIGCLSKKYKLVCLKSPGIRGNAYFSQRQPSFSGVKSPAGPRRPAPGQDHCRQPGGRRQESLPQVPAVLELLAERRDRRRAPRHLRPLRFNSPYAEFLTAEDAGVRRGIRCLRVQMLNRRVSVAARSWSLYVSACISKTPSADLRVLCG